MILLLFLIASSTHSQDKVSGYFSLQYNKTVSDITFGNNPSGVGLGLETYINTKSKFKLTAEVTGHIYLENDKVFRMTTSGNGLESVGSMLNVFAGASFHPGVNAFFSFLVGPSFIDGDTRFGIKPSMGFYFDKGKKIMGKMSYINIFNRVKSFKEDFGTINITIGFKLY